MSFSPSQGSARQADAWIGSLKEHIIYGGVYETLERRGRRYRSLELYHRHRLIEKNGLLSFADARMAYYDSEVA